MHIWCISIRNICWIWKEINLLLWTVSLGSMCLMVFGLYVKKGEAPLSRVSLLLYQSTSRVIWSVGLGYIVYACSSKQGGLFNSFFCLKIWIPLSRLSFSAYLVHMNIQLTYVKLFCYFLYWIFERKESIFKWKKKVFLQSKPSLSHRRNECIVSLHINDVCYIRGCILFQHDTRDASN